MKNLLFTRRSMLTSLTGATMLTSLSNPANAALDAPSVLGGLQPLDPTDQPIDMVSMSRLEAVAKKSLTPGAFAYIQGGAGDEWTLAQNELALRNLPLRPHRLAGFTKADLTTSLLGKTYPLPFYVCPMGAQDFAHPEAEIASASAAAAVGALYVLSSASNKPLETVAQASGNGPRWFALYMNTDQAVNRQLLGRVRTAGYTAVVMTVDSLGPGKSDEYLALGSPKTPTAGAGNYDPRFGGSGSPANVKKDYSPTDIRFIREASGGLPVLVKGILRPEDAKRCLNAGAAGIIVSNHGGRTLDGAPASISVLAPIVKAVDGRIPVLFDSGVRRGIDIVRALALGATAVGIGRPVLYGMALSGAAGAQRVLEHFRDDLATAMLLVGAKAIKDLTPRFIEVPGYTVAPARK